MTSLQPSAFEEKAIEKVDDLLESYMGIRDTELGEWAPKAGVEGLGSGPGMVWTCCPLSLHSFPLWCPCSSDHGRAGQRQKKPR